MPSPSGNGSDADKPQRRPPARKRTSIRKRTSRKDDGKKSGESGHDSLEELSMVGVHDHFLKLLREEAKGFNDPFLLYLYDMVIYRNEHKAD